MKPEPLPNGVFCFNIMIWHADVRAVKLFSTHGYDYPHIIRGIENIPKLRKALSLDKPGVEFCDVYRVSQMECMMCNPYYRNRAGLISRYYNEEKKE